MTKKTNKSTAKEFDYKSIKTFGDACKRIGIEPSEPEIKAVHSEPIKAMIAYYKLVIIFLAINNGWKPAWSDYNQWKYYPWFYVPSSGFGFVVSDYFCTDTIDKALYIAQQFKDLYQDHLLY